MYTRLLNYKCIFAFCSSLFLFSNLVWTQDALENRPNILFFITDDQSWIHTSFAGEVAIKTPGFDKIASEGIYFENAFCAAPSCSPSRGAIITGQEIWRLGEAAQLFSAVPRELSQLSFPLLLEDNGYHVGYTQKGWAPNDFRIYGWEKYPLGQSYIEHQIEPLTECIVKNDYFRNFEDFLDAKEDDEPFFFWCGTSEPHRAFEKGSGMVYSIDPHKISVPGFLPDVLDVRSDIADYLLEIKWTDQHLEKIIDLLEKRGQLYNTMIIVTSDNGMAFPGAKATLYEYGIHIPLAIRWGRGIKSAGRLSDVMVSLTDLAPTILELAELTIPDSMTGKSLKDIFFGLETKDRSYVFSGKERHTVCREGDLPYPQRAVRDHRFLYIRNLEPDRWPAGSPTMKSSHGWEYGDIDMSPSLTYLKENKNKPAVENFFVFATGKRRPEELFDIVNDPACQRNLIDDKSFELDKVRLSKVLSAYLFKTEDPRAMNGKSAWDDYPYYFKNPNGIIPYHTFRNE